MKSFCTLNFLFLFQLGFAQNFQEATIKHFMEEHFPFDKEIIAQEKIKTIEKVDYRFDFDTVYLETVVEKYEFDSLGNPSYVFIQPISQDKHEIFYHYDSLNQLIGKEIYGISPELRYKMIESYEWKYNEGFIARQRRYLMLNTMPLTTGVSGFPEQLFLYQNDSIVYMDTGVVIITNDKSHCDDVADVIYPPSFKRKLETTLKFHPNQNIASETVNWGGGIQEHLYNECGKLINASQAEKCANFFPNKVACLDQIEMDICHQLDTTRLNGTLVYYTRRENSFFQHDSGPGTNISSVGYTYYNSDFNKVYAVDTTKYERGPWHIPDDFGSDYGARQRITFTNYEYFDFGLIRKITTTNDEGLRMNEMEYKIEVYD